MASHDHSSMDTSGGEIAILSMSSGPSQFYMQQMYWAVVGAAVGVAAGVNLVDFLLYRHRLRAARGGDLSPAKPKSMVLRIHATVTAITREASNVALPPIKFQGSTFPAPTLGRTSLVVANVITLVVLCFYAFDTKDQWQYEDIGYRTGCITIAQLPLLFLLAGKKNILGWLTGTSYERINWLHRWAARCMFLTATIHMGYWFSSWAPYDYIGTKVKTDPITQRGVISWSLLAWIVFSSSTPIRGWSHEVFVLQHLVSFSVFIGFVYLHTPTSVHTYIWIPVALFFFDRTVRALSMLYINISLFHPKQRKLGQMPGLWACKAEFTPLPHNTTKITIRNPSISWTAGQHMFLSCHSIVPLQSHPFTVCSIPTDGTMEFLVKAEKGGTRRFFRHAQRHGELPTTGDVTLNRARTVAIEGPYGCMRPLRQFDSVVFFAGSTGSTFTMPLLRDLVAAWSAPAGSPSSEGVGTSRRTPGVVTRYIRFVWIVKSRSQLGWFAPQLSQVLDDVAAMQQHGQDIAVDISVYVTCDDTFTSEQDLPQAIGTSATSDRSCGPDETADVTSLNEKAVMKAKDEGMSPRGMESTSESSSGTPSKAPACGEDGTCCCCTITVEDEDATNASRECCCHVGRLEVLRKRSPGKETESSLSSASTVGASKPTLHPSATLLSGRPKCRTVIRKTLEQALGESAVVVCGPRGLVSDVRSSVVALSDERAVHKGTGAQGVFLHTEEFNF